MALTERFFGNPDVAYLQAHYATRGCHAARIIRAGPLDWVSDQASAARRVLTPRDRSNPQAARRVARRTTSR
ncbi:DUF1203 domain-containing protein [Sphingomonas faeni]|nr:DUF1203 domain-containing protein [Sphingomonas faeni]MCK8455177.1 DUF1203 domain-containing protein [Sphingomonas faeni]